MAAEPGRSGQDRNFCHRIVLIYLKFFFEKHCGENPIYLYLDSLTVNMMYCQSRLHLAVCLSSVLWSVSPCFWRPWHSWGILPKHLFPHLGSSDHIFFAGPLSLQVGKITLKVETISLLPSDQRVYDPHIILLQKQKVTQFLLSLNAHFLLKQPNFTSYFISVLSGTSQYWIGPIPQSTNNLEVFFILNALSCSTPSNFPVLVWGAWSVYF